ncbi:MAG TPA: FliM/FliN family flagellar motor switch protein, partial [Gemmataceae bacterium]|nr:FliM/FliN family flagellar motor switch protein [Gemmataceae bacterium]
MSSPRHPEDGRSGEDISSPGSTTLESNPSGSASDVIAKVADFAELREAAEGAGAASLDRLLDVDVTVTAELGRAMLSIGDILKLNIGSVLELDRPVSEPVDLMVQGVRLARGEVVVVEDCFAIRIK